MLRIIFNKSNIETIEIPLKRSMVYSQKLNDCSVRSLKAEQRHLECNTNLIT